MFRTELLGKNKRHILCSANIFGKSCRLSDNVGKKIRVLYSQTGHKWQYNTAHALCMLDT